MAGWFGKRRRWNDGDDDRSFYKEPKANFRVEGVEKSNGDEIIKYSKLMVNKLDVISADVKEIKQQMGNVSTLSGTVQEDKSPSISDAELGELARLISSKSMQQIAITCLGFKTYELDNEEMGAKGSQWKFNFNILTTWRNTCMETYPRQALAEALFKSARTSGIIDYRTVEGILGVSAESLTPKQEFKVAWCSPWEGPEASQKGSDAMLYRLAQQITCGEELRVLVLKGLEGPYHRLEANLCNHPGDIKEAAYQTLKEWFRLQPGNKQAYQSLCSALQQANMAFLIEVLND